MGIQLLVIVHATLIDGSTYICCPDQLFMQRVSLNREVLQQQGGNSLLEGVTIGEGIPAMKAAPVLGFQGPSGNLVTTASSLLEGRGERKLEKKCQCCPFGPPGQFYISLLISLLMPNIL